MSGTVLVRIRGGVGKCIRENVLEGLSVGVVKEWVIW